MSWSCCAERYSGSILFNWSQVKLQVFEKKKATKVEDGWFVVRNAMLPMCINLGIGLRHLTVFISNAASNLLQWNVHQTAALRQPAELSVGGLNCGNSQVAKTFSYFSQLLTFRNPSKLETLISMPFSKARSRADPGFWSTWWLKYGFQIELASVHEVHLCSLLGYECVWSTRKLRLINTLVFSPQVPPPQQKTAASSNVSST